MNRIAQSRNRTSTRIGRGSFQDTCGSLREWTLLQIHRPVHGLAIMKGLRQDIHRVLGFQNTDRTLSSAEQIHSKSASHRKVRQVDTEYLGLGGLRKVFDFLERCQASAFLCGIHTG